MSPQTSRRSFLKKGVIATVAIGVTACGGTALAASYQPPVDLPSFNYGEKTMTQRTLVTYASKAGSTAEVAARIGETLAKRGSAVDVLPIGKVSDLTPYGTVVVGSAIRMGRVLPEVKSFIEKNQAALQKKSFSTFVVCLTLKDDTAENRTAVAAYLDPVRALVKPASEGLFAGVMNPNKIGLLDRLIMMAMKSPEGDYRKWDQITAWAEGVAA
jgi:menaquinone-dependent protoporphyrinogen oxidase